MAHTYDQPLAFTNTSQDSNGPKPQSHGPSCTTTSAVLHRDLHETPKQVVGASGLYLTLSNGRRIIDATGGAAVSCIGHGDQRVRDVISSQIATLDYCHSLCFSCPSSEALARTLIDSTQGAMARVFIVNSGACIHSSLYSSQYLYDELSG